MGQAKTERTSPNQGFIQTEVRNKAGIEPESEVYSNRDRTLHSPIPVEIARKLE